MFNPSSWVLSITSDLFNQRSYRKYTKYRETEQKSYIEKFVFNASNILFARVNKLIIQKKIFSGNYFGLLNELIYFLYSNNSVLCYVIMLFTGHIHCNLL